MFSNAKSDLVTRLYKETSFGHTKHEDQIFFLTNAV